MRSSDSAGRPPTMQHSSERIYICTDASSVRATFKPSIYSGHSGMKVISHKVGLLTLPSCKVSSLTARALLVKERPAGNSRYAQLPTPCSVQARIGVAGVQTPPAAFKQSNFCPGPSPLLCRSCSFGSNHYRSPVGVQCR